MMFYRILNKTLPVISILHTILLFSSRTSDKVVADQDLPSPIKGSRRASRSRNKRSESRSDDVIPTLTSKLVRKIQKIKMASVCFI